MSVDLESRNPISTRMQSWMGAMLLGALDRSWRSEIVGLQQVDTLLGEGRKVMVAFWHGGYLPLFPLLKGRRAAIIASSSRRGQVLCGICRRFGQDCVRIPDRSGDRALAILRTALAEKNLAALAADGPLGPYRVVKRGVCQLAADLQMVLLPAAFAARPCKVLTGRWDRMTIPLPFAQVCLVFGQPLQVPEELDGESMKVWTCLLHDALEEAERVAARRLDGENINLAGS